MLEDRVVEIIATEQKEKRIKKKCGQSERSLGQHQHTKIHIIRVTEGENIEKGANKISEEIIFENLLKLGKETVNQVQKAQNPIQD